MIGNEILLAIQDYVKRSHRANFLIKNECIIEPILKKERMNSEIWTF